MEPGFHVFMQFSVIQQVRKIFVFQVHEDDLIVGDAMFLQSVDM